MGLYPRYRIPLLCILCLSAIPALGQQVYKTTATGVAAGTKNTARPEAILNAQRDIVLSYLEAQVPREALPALRPLLDKASVYVPTYRVGRERLDDGVLTLTIDATVLESALRRDMGALLEASLPRGLRAALVVGVDDPAFAALTQIVEDAVAEGLKESPVEAEPSAEIRRFFDSDSFNVAAESDRVLAAEIARASFAHLAIGLWIETSLIPQAGDSNVLICHATLRAQLIDSTTGSLLREMGEESKVQSANPIEGFTQALEDILATFTDQLVEETLLACVRADPSLVIEIEVADVGAESRWNEVCERLKNLYGDTAIEPMLYRAESGRLRLYTEDSLGAVARGLTQKDFGEFYLEVARAVERSMKLEIVDK